jgi:predicted aspartyl protease
MIIGKISENREALIELEVIGVNWQQRIVATIDTGFDGYLTLPLYMINRLGL